MPLRRDEPLVTIATFGNGFEAGLARGALEAIGIQALVPQDAFARQGVVATPASLQVFESDSARAIVELRRMQIRIVKTVADEG
ncbi:MAG TPA: hypothetical protein VFV95_15945 [Vicinamibacterales bacterium]|nr:hypothetical protein [Vicinamibacterales bacterium]